MEKPCEREWDESAGDPGYWWCVNDHTGCAFNNGHNSCCHDGNSLTPLHDDEDEGDDDGCGDDR